jgi:hypothetical protein
MSTDNWPVTFDYISDRLVRTIVQQSEAGGRRRRRLRSVGVPWFSAEWESGGPQFDNPFDLVRRATKAVRNITGTLESPGVYFRAEADIRIGWVRVDTRGKPREAAAFFADLRLPETRIFLALFGSMSNYGGFAPADRRAIWSSGLSISMSLYAMLDEALEDGDVPDSRSNGDDAGDRYADALSSASYLVTKMHDGLPPERREFLAKVHVWESDAELYGGAHYDIAILGSPVWVATPEPRPMGEVELPLADP